MSSSKVNVILHDFDMGKFYLIIYYHTYCSLFFPLEFTMYKFLVQCWNVQGSCSPESRLTLKLTSFTKN